MSFQNGKAILQTAYSGGQNIPQATAVAYPSASSGNGWGGPSIPTITATTNSFSTNVSNGGGMLFPNPNSGIVQSFFVEYANTVKRIEALSHVDQEIKKSNQEINDDKKQIDELGRKLAKARKDQPKLEARINRNENPRFFHYMQLKRKDKVDKLKKNLQDMISSQEKWTGEKQYREAELKKHTAEFHGLKNAEATRNNLAQKRQSMYDQAVASVPPTRRLLQIENNIQQQAQQITLETNLLQRVDGVLQTIQRAEQLYGQSMQMLRQAQQSNTTATFVNFADGGGPEIYEKMQQAQRDRLINESQMPANQAYNVMQQAWAQFPSEAKQRYPSIASQIGQAPLPQLRGAHFGNTLATGLVFGDIGDAINNGYASGKIRENMQIIDQCARIIGSQHQLVSALRNAIATNISQMQTQLKKLQHQRDEERDVIFTTVRSNVMSNGFASAPSIQPSVGVVDSFPPSVGVAMGTPFY